MKRKTDDALILKLHGEGKSQRKIARELGCSKTAVLKRLKKMLLHGGDHTGNQMDGVSARLIREGKEISYGKKYR